MLWASRCTWNSASIAVVDWISSAREYNCASGPDLDRVEREISNIFSLVITEGKRAPLPKSAWTYRN